MSKVKATSIILIIIIVVILSTLYINRGSEKVGSDSLREEISEEIENAPTESISVKHQYKDGGHVFVGTISLPTPCHSFNAVIEDKDVPEIQITTNKPEDGNFCAQVITDRDYKVSYTSTDPDLKFNASINGTPYRLNIFEISPNDDIDSIELFLKG